MSRNWTTDVMSALYTKPRVVSLTRWPWAAAYDRIWVGSRLDMAKRIRAYVSGSSASELGKVTGEPPAAETWRLNSRAAPSAVLRAVIAVADSVGSPSVDSPSVRLMTMGGNPRDTARSSLLPASLRT